MVHTLGTYRRLLMIQLRSQMQYRASFFMEIISTAFLNASFFLSLVFVMERFGTINGWSIGEIAFLAGMVEMSFATMDMMFAGFDPDWFSPLVRLGTFDQYLLRPIGITLQIMGARLVLRRIGRIAEGLIIFLLGIGLNSIQWTAAKLIYLPVVFASQVICFASLFILGSTLTFWTMQPIEAVNIVTYGGNEMMTYPMSIYPQWVRRVFTFILPFIFLNYYPALYFLNKPDPLNFPDFAPFVAPFAAVLMFLLALQVWRFGIRHYQSAGS